MKRILTTALFFCIGYAATANNISISNVSLTGQNVTAGTNNVANFTLVQFSMTYENSHRVTFGPNNWDAAWVFIKYRVSGGTWQHARLSNTGHTTPIGSTITTGLQTHGTAYNLTTNPGTGVFIYRNAAGTGTFTSTNVQLRWNYGANSVADNAVVEVQVYGVEMVYVTGGSYTVGDGFSSGTFATTSINTANATTLPTGSGGLAGGYPNGQTAPSTASWPNGFNAFYSMKYEISQQQYVDFLNSLTSTQATARFLLTNGTRMAITVLNGVYSTTAPNLAMSYLSWLDLAAYLDWSGLRPMTELEFEKACRGNLTPVAAEYAWGSTSITNVTGLTNAGLANEVASNAGANALFNNNPVAGPVRVGMFAGAATTRAQAGASYFGIMELSGNVGERAITIRNVEGRSFTGSHGDGTLSTAGEANTATWPSATTPLGITSKGGAFNTPSAFLSVSYRTDYSDITARDFNSGGRGVRTAP